MMLQWSSALSGVLFWLSQSPFSFGVTVSLGKLFLRSTIHEIFHTLTNNTLSSSSVFLHIQLSQGHLCGHFVQFQLITKTKHILDVVDKEESGQCFQSQPHLFFYKWEKLSSWMHCPFPHRLTPTAGQGDSRIDWRFLEYELRWVKRKIYETSWWPLVLSQMLLCILVLSLFYTLKNFG